MPEVRILGGELRRLVGSPILYLPARAVAELLDALARRAGPELATRLYRDPDAPRRTLHRDLRVLVNGRNLVFLDQLDTPLQETDVVTLHCAGARGFPGG